MDIIFFLLFLFYFFSNVGIKPRALHMVGKCSCTESHPRTLGVDLYIISFSGDPKFLMGHEAEEEPMEV
jgi:hypothetical protein